MFTEEANPINCCIISGFKFVTSLTNVLVDEEEDGDVVKKEALFADFFVQRNVFLT
ncbi:MAG: hypothetical protein LR001_10630 [Clostridiales bacterium]|nr:hypothetical protein [Clostridiales bacterium]